MHRRHLLLLATLCLTLHTPSLRALDVVVDPTGQGQTKKTLKEALDSLPANDAWARVLIRPGQYVEHLAIRRPRTCLIGLGLNPEDVVITFNLSAVSPRPDGSGNVGTTGSASTLVTGSDFLASNVTFANSTPDNVAQAVALKTSADRVVFDRCRFIGFQDTLYPTGGRHYFRNCYVTGDTDFIFGNATAVFDHCEINSSDRGFITAANTPANAPHGFVFLDCLLIANPEVTPNSTFLGRPWQWDRGAVASVTFVRTRMSPHIAAAGWHPWDLTRNTHPEKTTRFAEFETMDIESHPLDNSSRVPWARTLTADEAARLTPAHILAGPDHWDPHAIIRAHLPHTPASSSKP